MRIGGPELRGLMLLWLGTAVAAPDGAALIERTTEFVETLGGRPARTPAGDAAQTWAFQALTNAGWRATREPRDGYVVGCHRGADPRSVLFLAHTDTVHADVPGAVDNAASVILLVALAEELASPGAPVPPRTVCLAFPDAEELGLLGSRRLAEAWLGHFGHPLDQVMALDLVGRGATTHNGLGPAWGARSLQAFLSTAPADVPFVYRALSHGWPHMERSDHHWFGRRGIPSSHLMGRPESGVLWTYHTRDDVPTTLEADAMVDGYRVVRAVAYADPLPGGPRGGWALVVPFTTVVVPGGLVGVGMVALLGVAAGLRWHAHRAPARRPPASEVALGALASGIGGFVALMVASAGRSFGFSLAGFVALAGWSGVAVSASLRGGDGRLATTLLTAWFVALGGLGFAFGLPLLAVPLVAAAAATAWLDRPGGVFALPIALWPALYLVRGDAIRELHHHGLVPAGVVPWTTLLLALTGPLAVVVARGSARVRSVVGGVAGLALIIAVVGAWTTPVMAPPHVRGARYVHPDRPPVPPVPDTLRSPADARR